MEIAVNEVAEIQYVDPGTFLILWTKDYLPEGETPQVFVYTGIRYQQTHELVDVATGHVLKVSQGLKVHKVENLPKDVIVKYVHLMV